MKDKSVLRKNNHSVIAIALVLAVWFLTFIPIQASLSQPNVPRSQTNPNVPASTQQTVSQSSQKPVIWFPQNKNYVSFVRERKVDVKLSTNLNQTGVTWYFLKNGNKVPQLDESFFSAEIMGDTAIFRHKREKYDETTVTIVATAGQQDIKKELPVFVYEIEANDYVTFYHDEEGKDKTGKIPINLSLNHSGQSIKWYLLNPREDKENKIEEEFFTATVVGDKIEFEGVRDKFGESIITVAATKVFTSTDPTQPKEEERIIAEKQIKVIVPSEKTLISKIAKVFHCLKSRRWYISLIIKGGDVMLPIILLLGIGLGLSFDRLWVLFLKWYPGDKNKGKRDRLKRTNLSEYANDIISGKQKISPEDNNPIAKIFKVGIEAKEEHFMLNPSISEERLESIIREERLESIIREEMEKEIEKQEEELNKCTRAIEVCNILAPMFGFFGTIVGLIIAFMNWTNSAMAGENIRVEGLAGGMYQAMITTAGGLIVAIPLSALLGIIFYRIRKFTRVMNDSKDEMLKSLVGAASGSTPPIAGGGTSNPPGANTAGQGGNPTQSSSGGGNNNPQGFMQSRNVARRTRIKNNRKIKTPGMFAMVDIVMNLFIFFFIAFNLIAAFKTDKESNVKDVSIPRTDSPGPVPIKPVRVTIQRDRTILLVLDINRTKPVTPVELTELVIPVLKEQNNLPGFEEDPNQEVPSVIISVDEEVDYNYVMQVLNAVKDSGLLKIGLTATTL